MNFAKTNWTSFRDYFEELLASSIHLPTYMQEEEAAGCIKEIRPNFPSEAADLPDERGCSHKSDLLINLTFSSGFVLLYVQIDDSGDC